MIQINGKLRSEIEFNNSPSEKEVIDFPYRINIDTGCFFSGKLSSVCLNDNNNERKFIYS